MKSFASEYKILIVDDIPTNVMLVEAILKKEGYSLITADNGVDALKIAQEQHPNIILLDIMMPGMDGYEVLQHLKSNPDTNAIPVIIMSALNDMPSIIKGYQLGATEYVTKPFQREELVKRIAHRFELYSIERIKEELVLTIESRDMLYSVISHDLRTPLGSLKMMNNSILKMVDRERVGDDVYEMLLLTNKTSEDTFQLLDNLTKWSKYTQNKIALHKQKTDINGLIESIITIYQPIAELKRVSIISKGLDETLSGIVDVDMVKTIVRNLLSNAVKFSYEGGTVEIATRLEDNYLYFSVTDHGKGLKEGDKERLFNAEHFSTFGTDNEQGSGLGLMISKTFVDLHEGKIWFKSEEGKGTTIFFTLKIREKDEDDED
ncbi:two-component system sensor histidine kinase/response regulator [Parabacteroides sp. PF5-5]|uniref:hybrid sensor histidine kinase/response regulator n=1 Tax=unclassified Parabacteroides TaxID=2649774 RepID=UPI00247529EB|nr:MULTISPECIES: hybrid sensor histidine kinase/response regulator [unclassified Parabacteroides]MDH6306547.1 two-component system sensor histidine kinase/response regulator [Parabacteroides sp. PH5-39]MDH6317514.1 two-component system sensor histidine kinase/response regulator [Parabacteroides sp. PF5-13]MDH6321258.1 two-component system sensor histidine kinase/response regulator [Parabacteroides sp. PH5-13]MDH6324990.1 two-component system sensor histidine kinase/response regulator [Parabacte